MRTKAEALAITCVLIITGWLSWLVIGSVLDSQGRIQRNQGRQKQRDEICARHGMNSEACTEAFRWVWKNWEHRP